ncbi:MAG TPA: alkaline shock response membrane anchor protein AmaP [Candidatus Pullichristensenella excrementigallinarum]|uniref:Alkaline shock response membrane anchor protein AmaP n=1 Tax=Candidatus Pullichristensenella excrementigallinarum TaxID=2840907 RepID=A0A9D1LDG6_9FIRM|nr:alkaline shock response membrane anchor protein AmaP [Candidatus Pullichristensenella excrementigallinarum]
MKLSFWDRVLMFLYVLIVLFLCLAMALRLFGLDLIGDTFAQLRQGAGNAACFIIAGGLVLILALLSVFMLMMIFQTREKRRNRSFITVNSDDGGRVRVAISVLSQMVRQVVGRVEGVRDMKIRIDGDEDAVVVGVDLSLDSGVHVPTVTFNMRRSIREHIENKCGVDVRDVEITVNSMADAQAPEKKRFARWNRTERKAAQETADAPMNASAPIETAPEVALPVEPEEEHSDAFEPSEESVPAEEVSFPEEAEEDGSSEIENSDLFAQEGAAEEIETEDVPCEQTQEEEGDFSEDLFSLEDEDEARRDQSEN